MCRKVAYILDLVLVEVGDSIDHHPWDRASEVDELMHYEGQDSRCQDIILHESIPCSPQAFEYVKVNIVLGYFVELAPVGVRRRVEEAGGGRVPTMQTVSDAKGEKRLVCALHGRNSPAITGNPRVVVVKCSDGQVTR